MTWLVIEGEPLTATPDLWDSNRLALKPGFYVRHRGDCLKVSDPIYPDRVRDALGLGGEPRRNLIAVGLDGVPHLLDTFTSEIEFFAAGGWRADVILMPHGNRTDPVRITLPRP